MQNGKVKKRVLDDYSFVWWVFLSRCAQHVIVPQRKKAIRVDGRVIELIIKGCQGMLTLESSRTSRHQLGRQKALLYQGVEQIWGTTNSSLYTTAHSFLLLLSTHLYIVQGQALIRYLTFADWQLEEDMRQRGRTCPNGLQRWEWAGGRGRGEEDFSKCNTNGANIWVTFPLSMRACKTYLHIFSQTFMKGYYPHFQWDKTKD